MKEPFVSVVTPFYNTDAYLEECIESVLRQRYSNFEYVLLNNASTDRSREIAERYAKRDSRIKLFDNEVLLPQVPNYNRALRHIAAESKYTKVVQADDWIFPDCLRSMVAVAEQSPEVGLVGAYGQIEERVFFYGLPLGSSLFRGAEVCRKLWAEGMYVFGSPTCVMYRSDLVRAKTDFYDLSCPLEDADVCCEILKNWSFGFVHQVLTFTRRQSGSIYSEHMHYNQEALLRLMTILRHGDALLEPGERDRLQSSVKRQYMRSVGECIVSGVGLTEGFWKFHRAGMDCCGFRPSWFGFAGHAVAAALDLLLNPKSTAERILRRWRRSGSSA